MRPLALAVTASAAVVLGAPYVGQIRGALQTVLPRQYVAIVAGVVAGSLLVAMVVAVITIRTHRRVRYAAVLGAVTIGATYAFMTRTGNAEVDAVEQFHFVEYGLLAWLFYRVWQSAPDVTAVTLPLAAGTAVGIVDEWFQWFIPSRVGDLRDVLLDAVAVACGLLFAIAVRPPRSRRLPADRRSRTKLAAGLTGAMALAALFVFIVHTGHEIRDPDTGTFRSRFERTELERQSSDRAGRWKKRPPVEDSLLAREDQYLAEGRWHIQRRNEAIGMNDLRSAVAENRILEKFFAPAIDLGIPGSRWSPEAEVPSTTDPAEYVSDAAPYAIYAWNPWAYWGIVAGVLGGLWSFVRAGAASQAPDVPRPCA